MTNIKFLLLGTSLSFIPCLTFAQCVATQDCATLGYTETSCSGGKGIKCPFGNKWVCLKTDSVCEQEACAKYGFKYSCSGINQSGGSGAACGGKYTACNCSSGYEWKNGSCQEQNGASGELYYCKGKVVGVKNTGMNFYVAMQDLGSMYQHDATNQCQSYSFCDNVTGTLPTANQLRVIYGNKSQVNSLLSTNGGTKMTEDRYWSSTYYGSKASYYVDMRSGLEDYGSNYSNLDVRPILTSW